MILVTGATGYVGRYVIQALLDSNAKVRCLVRDVKKINLPKVEVVQGDVTDPVSLAVACSGIRKIIHLVAIIREKKNNTFEDINIAGTENLLKVAVESGVEQFIHISALGASTDPTNKYTYSKGMAEVAVMNSGLNYTILRPSVIFGPGDGFVDRLVQSLLMTPTFVAVPGNGNTMFQPISVKDVARCIDLVTQHADTYKYRVIDLGGPEHLTYNQMLDILMSTLGLKKAKLHVPLAVVRPVTKIMERIMASPLITSVELAQLAKHNITNINAVREHFGFTPVKFADGLEYVRYKVKP